MLDENISAELPPGTQVLAINPACASKYVSTSRIDTRGADGAMISYFMKKIDGSRQGGKDMMKGCFESELQFYRFAPNHVPKPLAWGACKSSHDSYFFLSRFHELRDGVPEISRLCAIVAGIHRDSTGKSPTGKFGFHVTTRVLHGDLWPGNAKHEVSTGEIMIYDSGACWGHHEADLAEFRAPRYRLGKAYMEEYHRHVPKSDPVEEWDDRNRMYAIRYDLLVSAVFPNDSTFRKTAMQDMKFLIEKYSNGN